MNYVSRVPYAVALLLVTACSQQAPYGGVPATPTPAAGVATATPAATASAAVTSTPAATATPTPAATATPTPAATATPTPVPTATPTPAATPTPSPTASATASPSNVIVDGGFETEGAASQKFTSWTPCSFANSALQTSQVASASVTAAIESATSPSFTISGATTATQPTPHSGSYEALLYTGTAAQTSLGTTSMAGENGICQTFVLPANAVLTMYTEEGGYESSPTYGDQEADLFAGSISSLNGTPTPINLFTDFDTQNASPPTATTSYQTKTFNLASSTYNLTPGNTYTLYIGTADNSPSGKYGLYMFVDDVTLVGNVGVTSGSRIYSTRRH